MGGGDTGGGRGIRVSPGSEARLVPLSASQTEPGVRCEGALAKWLRWLPLAPVGSDVPSEPVVCFVCSEGPRGRGRPPSLLPSLFLTLRSGDGSEPDDVTFGSGDVTAEWMTSRPDGVTSHAVCRGVTSYGPLT